MRTRIALAASLSLSLSACFLLEPEPAPGDDPRPARPPTLRIAAGCNVQGGSSAREWNCTGDALNDAGRVQQAQRAYRRALASPGLDDRQRAYALGGLAVTSADLGDCEEAESAVEELRQLAPLNPLSRLTPPVCGKLQQLAGP
ncbi:MAG: tetratricopeptide repeat protein [Deltaproteobacteria bacterium]|nr:tetratricopeptide repeat protein [Deltaproteobacteria bacterium]MBW2415328.1 tetratricopeptide repeat protein [Deltaproteobacteria bacterium]